MQWWQQTAVQIISDFKYAAAIKPLVTALLTTSKLALNGIIKTALVRMAKDAEPIIIGALTNSDPDFKTIIGTYKDAEKETYLYVLADMLGFFSRTKGRDAVISIIKAGTLATDTGRGGLAQSLVQFPTSPDAEPSFQAMFAKLTDNSSWAPSLQQTMPQAPKASLIAASNGFYDAALVPWLLDYAGNQKTSATKLLPMDSAMKLMDADKKKSVSDFLDKVSPDIAKELNDQDKGPKNKPKAGDPPYVKMGDATVASLKELFTYNAKVIDDCKTDASCYVKILDEDIPSTPPTANQRQIKATYMAVIYAAKNGDKIRGDLLAHVDKVRNAAARVAIVQAIDELAPNGDTAAADALDKICDKDTAQGDNDLVAPDNVVKQISFRLRSRAM
jgi:hypothetical protein